MDKMELLKEKLQRLRELDPQFKVFGADAHKYRLNPCLTETEIRAFEAKHGITLPEDYRNFLLYMGNGGAGEGYLMYPMEKYWGYQHDEQAAQANPGFLMAPFPHSEAWNDEDSDAYYAPEAIQGSVMLAFLGCTSELRLVVNGPEKGNVWMDDRGADAGVFPLPVTENPADRLSFFDWYNAWLDESLSQFKK